MTDVTTPSPGQVPGSPFGPPPGPPADGWWSRPGEGNGRRGEPGTPSAAPPATAAAGAEPLTEQAPSEQAPTRPVPFYGRRPDDHDPWRLPGATTPTPDPREGERSGRWPAGPPTDPPSRSSRRRPGWIALVVATLVAGLVGGVVGSQMAPTTTPGDSGEAAGTTESVIDPVEPAARPPESVAGIADAALPSVVSISTPSGSGSGFVITDDGFIVTNNHVISGAGDDVVVSFQDGRTVDATVVGASPGYDLAVLDVDLADLTPLALGDSDQVVVGDPVVAVGSPLGLDGTVTAGIVSATERPVTAGGQGEVSFINAIQTDAAINPGNSGGPLLDASGRVIGVNSSIAALTNGFGGQAGSIGLGFAIPINQARLTAEQIIATGEASYPVIGATLDVRDTSGGAVIGSLVPGGPADQVGLRSGDRVVAIDGQRVNGADELIVAIRARQPGDTVELTVERGDTEETLTLTLDSRVG